ncbi:MAG TPA: hypothetical protein VL326_32980 [Kofleriaceae bacterium]|jgi:hypothetical protein|nr:hypothetical protein [Kofleriaceae bacterium]
MRWLLLIALLAGCDSLFQLTHLKDPPADSGGSDAELGDGMSDAPKDAPDKQGHLVQSTYGLSATVTSADLNIPPQVSGDLNVVFISWLPSGASVTGVVDQLGNQYSILAPETSSSNLSQVAYYAENIQAGANRLTVTFNSIVANVNIRVLEYGDMAQAGSKLSSHVNTGSSAAISLSANFTTTVPVIAVAGIATLASGLTPGPSYVERIDQTYGYAMDREIIASGTYPATATQAGTSTWIIQLGIFATQ